MKYWYNEKLTSYPHSVIAASSNAEGLFKFSKAATLKDEVVVWLNENIGDDYTLENILVSTIRFRSEESVMAFILRWS